MTPTARTVPTDDWLTVLAGAQAAALVWRDPPPSRSHRPDRALTDRRRCFDPGVLPDDPATFRSIASSLRSMPHRWAIVYTGDHFSALKLQQYVKFGRRGFRYAGQYEAVLRVVDGGMLIGATDLYARFVGAPEVWNGTPVY